jgi:hypothetical protein
LNTKAICCFKTSETTPLTTQLTSQTPESSATAELELNISHIKEALRNTAHEIGIQIGREILPYMRQMSIFQTI